MKLIIGLGNPGKKYESTRHNVGFLVLDELARRWDATFRNKTAVEAELADVSLEDSRMILCKPQTFMNASGKAVQKVMKKNSLDPQDLLIIYDDADLPLGDIRYRSAGSAGGHNGVQSILDLFPRNTPVARVRVGIGRPNHSDYALEDWVLSTWTDKERERLPQIIEAATDEVQEQIQT